MNEHDLPVLPLVLADVPPALERLAARKDPIQRFEAQPRAGCFVLFDSSRAPCPELPEAQLGIDVHALRGSSTEDPFAVLDDEQSRRVRWWVGHLAVSEEVARVDKRAARQQLLAGVRMLVEAAGGLWLRAAAFPYPYRSAFNFRLDYDEYHAEDFATVLELVQRQPDASATSSARRASRISLKRSIGCAASTSFARLLASYLRRSAGKSAQCRPRDHVATCA